ncbi:melanopsin-A-like isoform X2 [Bolinopsis microptera]|uniref:melanopsin-A-like isoform X2 n=1 Tax=Bolinopsis microptera TaxID=2820187 RepID=UPI00307A5C0A
MTQFVVAESLNKSIDYPIVEEVLSVGYYSILMFLATFGNIFIIYATMKVRARSHDAMTILLIRVLAFNDLLGGLILYPNFILLLSKGYFPFNATYCIVLGIFEIYCPLCSTLLVMALVLTKVAMIRNPFLSMGNARKIFLVLPPLYILGLIAPMGVFFNMGNYMFSPERGTCTYRFYPDLLKEKIFIMSCTTLFVIIPLCVIISMSVYILRFMRRMRNKSISVLDKNTQVKRANDKILKSVVVVLLVVIAYVICWSMFFCVTTVAFLIGGEDTLPRQVLLWQKALLMTNNAVNPMVYVCGNKKLQLVLQQVIFRIRGLQIEKDFGQSTVILDTKPTFHQIESRMTVMNTRSNAKACKLPRATSEFSSVGRIKSTASVGSPSMGRVRCSTTNLPVAGKETRRVKRKCTNRTVIVPVGEECVLNIEREECDVLREECDVLSEKSEIFMEEPEKLTEEPEKLTEKSEILTEGSDVVTQSETTEKSDVVCVPNGIGPAHRNDISSDVITEESSIIPCYSDVIPSEGSQDGAYVALDDEQVLVKKKGSETENIKSKNKDIEPENIKFKNKDIEPENIKFKNKNIESDYNCSKDIILSSDPTDQIIFTNTMKGLNEEESGKVNGSILMDSL